MSRWEKHKALGDAGERLVREWLIKRGYYVLSVGLLPKDKAPAFIGALGRVVTSDILAYKGKRAQWVEVKTKSRSTENKDRGRWETGMPLANWEAYLEGQRETGIPGYLANIDLEMNRILFGTFDEIGATAFVYRKDRMPGGQPHIYFDINRFSEWYSLDGFEDITPTAEPPKVIRPWETRPPEARQGVLF